MSLEASTTKLEPAGPATWKLNPFAGELETTVKLSGVTGAPRTLTITVSLVTAPTAFETVMA
jgi:hypothetical protein